MSVSKNIVAVAKKNELKNRKAVIEMYCKSIHEASKNCQNG